MPFKSAKQRRACFATNGFHGAIDCHEWAHAKKEQGGMTMYRKKKCKKCGGKMKTYQGGGSYGIPKREDYPDQRSYENALEEYYVGPSVNTRTRTYQSINIPQNDFNDPSLRPSYQEPAAGQGPQYANRIQEGIAQGVLEAPRADSPDDQMSAQQWYDMHKGAPSQTKKKSPYDIMQRIGIGMRGVRTGLGWLSGIIERGRQNQYDYQQQTALGQMNPMQVNDFQPNPFSLYAKYGGNLKKVMKAYRHGGNAAMAPYHNLPADQYNLIAQQMGYHIMPDGTYMANDEMGNEYSNNAQYDFGSGDDDHGKMKKGGYEIDRMLIVRKLLPELFLMGRMGRHRWGNRYQAGGVYTNQAEIDKDNLLTQGILGRQGVPNASTYVAGRDIGDRKLKIVGQGNPQPMGATTLPFGIDISQVYNTTQGYGYEHPQYGNWVPVDPSIFQKYGQKQPIQPVSQMRDIAMAGKYRKGGNWIPKNLKKGRCTPAPNPDCPVGSPQYNLAMTFKKHHGFHKKK